MQYLTASNFDLTTSRNKQKTGVVYELWFKISPTFNYFELALAKKLNITPQCTKTPGVEEIYKTQAQLFCNRTKKAQLTISTTFSWVTNLKLIQQFSRSFPVQTSQAVGMHVPSPSLTRITSILLSSCFTQTGRLLCTSMASRPRSVPTFTLATTIPKLWVCRKVIWDEVGNVVLSLRVMIQSSQPYFFLFLQLEHCVIRSVKYETRDFQSTAKQRHLVLSSGWATYCTFR